GIVEVVDAGEDGPGGAPFLVMERIDGSSLSAWVATARERGQDAAALLLAGPGSTWQRIARTGAAIAQAVAFAHQHEVL
ncbi:MAG: hypothetical protein JNL62_29055, partial [Bryobacterales bacterium]|nr:hypothetical protein [Bryobacterales bacterium]